MVSRRRPAHLAAAAGLALAAAACGSSAPVAPAVLSTAPEPGVAPPTTVTPAGALIGVGHQPEGIVADGPTDEVAVSVRGPGSPGDGLELVSLAQGRVIAFVSTTGAARHLQLVGPGGPVIYPAEQSNSVYEISLTASGVLGQVGVGHQPHDATYLDGHVLATDELGNQVSVISGTSVTATVPVPVQPGGIVAGTEADGHTPVALVVGVRGRQVEALSPTGADLGVAAAGAGPTHVRYGGGHFYVNDTDGGAVLVYTVTAKGPRMVGSVSTGGGRPYGLAVDASRQHLWVTLTADNVLDEYAIRGDSLSLLHRYPTARQPNDVAVDPATGVVVVAGTGSDQIEVITPLPG